MATDPAGDLYVLLVAIADALYAPRAEAPLHGVETVGIVVRVPVQGGGTPEPIGMISKGSVVLEEAGRAPGDKRCARRAVATSAS